MNTLDWDENYSEAYLRSYGFDKSNDIAVSCLQLAPGAKIIELGCGGGYLISLIAKHNIPGDPDSRGIIYGLDPSPTMVAAAQRQVATAVNNESRKSWRIQLVRARTEQIPLPATWATNVIAANSIQFWREREQGLRELWRVMQSGSQLLLLEDDNEHQILTSPLLQRQLQTSGFRALQRQRINRFSTKVIVVSAIRAG